MPTGARSTGHGPLARAGVFGGRVLAHAVALEKSSDQTTTTTAAAATTTTTLTAARENNTSKFGKAALMVENGLTDAKKVA